jgi:hypothetical protein
MTPLEQQLRDRAARLEVQLHAAVRRCAALEQERDAWLEALRADVVKAPASSAPPERAA